ncbi:MAG TPA: hypothetical protein PKD53_20905 [Chloroflexaceae bacterium]|nr:hypothetical protein [Chloroflexaceae bacterium]
MSDQPASEEAARQRLGRRLGVEPYYVVAERGPGLLRLESRPGANRAAGLRVLAGAAALLLVAAVVAVSGLASAATGSGFAVAALAAVVAGLLGGLGYQRALGGYAVLTTGNSIVCDAAAGAITYTQRSRVGAARDQRLAFAQVDELRLRRRPLATGWPLRRVRPIVAVELVVGPHVWVVDTAADPEALRPAAEGLAEVLGREFAREG